jgi:type II secretory pathway pseudopilin PulG
MSRAAVALANSTPGAIDARSGVEVPAADSPRKSSPGRTPRRIKLTRTHLAIAVMAVIAVWLVIVFARAIADVNRATTLQQSVAAESAALTQQLAADRRELALVQTDAFQRIQARAYGLGESGERAFSLPADAPSPAPIVPLGSTSTQADSPATPLDAWLMILFGR